jgi:hypothetical protein
MFDNLLIFKNIKDVRHPSVGLIFYNNISEGVCDRNGLARVKKNVFLNGACTFHNSNLTNTDVTILSFAYKLVQYINNIK